MPRRNSCRTHRRAVDPSARRHGHDRHKDAHADRHILRILTRMAHKTGQDLIDEAKQQVEIYCARGNRSALAALTMKQMGYEDVASMARGFMGWADIGGEVEG